MNIQLVNLNISFTNEDPAPFFQVESENKLRLDIDYINRDNLTRIVNILFKDDDSINLSYYYGTVFPKIFKEPTRIGKYISINNWKEVYAIVTIKSIRKSELINYLLYLKHALKDPYMCIYNEHNLLCNSSDVIDIVSGSAKMINDLKSVYEPIVNHFYSKE
ncbi:hypothetical protein BUZ11_08560 [Staphylococcus gallinarum]|uniref:hypothetical protein n=1 Tax=Staphylococcus gallinarum TaxID=1293 RepID=UPI000E69DD99|nr:hypothetical protein [Staphylococcus gallinarum]MCD8871682.1 hypothetical protein [Staphylococcus gallinarum]MCW0986079.1 hypothetical protein [Staphylococcus gallinarum]RIO82197.1 hypothetical protein BUZ11_08560 [Staphylococcus gallinarum]